MTTKGGANRPRFRLLSTVLLTVAILGLPTAVYAWGRTSSSFVIRSIEVKGARQVPERRVERLLRRDYLGRNLFTVTTADVRGTLAPLCYVAGASVDRDFPGTLRVTVTEHHPAAYLLSAGSWYVLAADGHVICAVKPAAKPGKAAAGNAAGAAATTASPTPLATDASPAPGLSPSPAQSSAASGAPDVTSGLPGGTRARDSATSAPTPAEARRLAALTAGPPRGLLHLPRVATNGPVREGATLQDPGVTAALRLIAALPPGLRGKLEVVETDAQGQTTLHFGGGLVAVWGEGDRLLAKGLALRAVLNHYSSAGKTCVFIDVSIPDRVLARPILK
jgi:cell division septal protein FtsQ